jgi:hypothetical protein
MSTVEREAQWILRVVVQDRIDLDPSIILYTTYDWWLDTLLFKYGMHNFYLGYLHPVACMRSG